MILRPAHTPRNRANHLTVEYQFQSGRQATAHIRFYPWPKPRGPAVFDTVKGIADALVRSPIALEDIDAIFGVCDARLVFLYTRIERMAKKREKV